MKFFLKKTILVNLIAGFLTFTSCRSDEPGNVEESQVSNVPRVTMTVNTVSLGSVNEGVIEKIRTLRIIMVTEVELEDNSTVSYVELNRLVDFQNSPSFSGPGEYATNFRYVFTRPTVPGIKKFYLIANESSVGNVNFQTEEDLPEGISNGMNLSDFLAYYKPNYIPGYEEIPGLENGEGEPRGVEFESLINCLYYTPEFVTEDEGASIYLP